MKKDYTNLFIASALIIFIGGCGIFANNYLIFVATAAAWLVILAISYDVLIGYTGYLSLAHGTFYGIGAYSCAIFTAKLKLSFWLALPLSASLAALIGVLIASLAFRTRGLYFSVLTLGLGLIGHQFFVIADDITGGIVGFVGIPSPPQPFGLQLDQLRYNFWLSLTFCWITYISSHFFTRSDLGTACLAIREDPVMAQAVGIKINSARLSAFGFSAFFAGISGALFAAMSNFVGPDSFSVLGAGFQLAIAVVIGGMGTLWGPALGAILLTSLPEMLRGASSYSLLAYGILLLLVMIFAPRGIAGILKKLSGRMTKLRLDAQLPKVKDKQR
jgi:branched-chain amino acid transport system permease protein